MSDIVSVGRPVCSTGTTSGSKLPGTSHVYISRHGKAPPVDPFTADDVNTTFDDWLLMLQQAVIWNNWTPEESLMQLAGYLRGKAAQVWKLLLPEEKDNSKLLQEH